MIGVQEKRGRLKIIDNGFLFLRMSMHAKAWEQAKPS